MSTRNILAECVLQVLGMTGASKFEGVFLFLMMTTLKTGKILDIAIALSDYPHLYYQYQTPTGINQ